MRKESSVEYKSKLKCPDCGSSRIIYDHDNGEVVCGSCGLVIFEQMISGKEEWRAYNFQEERARNRVGYPVSYIIHDKGLSTVMYDRDPYGHELSSKTKEEMLRLKKWQMRFSIQFSKEKKFIEPMAELHRLADKLFVPKSLTEDAGLIYRKASKKGLIRGYSTDSMIAASLYTVWRERGIPRTLDEIASVSSVNKKEIGKCYRHLVRGLNLKIPIQNPFPYLSKTIEKLHVSNKTRRLAMKILEEVSRSSIARGKSPNGLAAVSLYIAYVKENDRSMNSDCKKRITQEDIAKAAGVTRRTVRNLYKKLKEELNISSID